jgi:hypothetical protein
MVVFSKNLSEGIYQIYNFKLSELNLLKTKRAMKEKVLGTSKSVKEQRETPKQFPLITDIFFTICSYIFAIFSSNPRN